MWFFKDVVTFTSFDIPHCVIPSFFTDALWDYAQGTLIVVGKNATAGIFATYPSKHLTLLNGFFDQVRLNSHTSPMILCVILTY